MPKTTAGIGQIVNKGGLGESWVAPSGGTWLIIISVFNANSTANGFWLSIAAGGQALNQSQQTRTAWSAIRIA